MTPLRRAWRPGGINEDVFFCCYQEGKPPKGGGRLNERGYLDRHLRKLHKGAGLSRPYVSRAAASIKLGRAGHPLQPENSEIRAKLIQVFAPWYFEHNNENDENMCYVKVEPDSGFFHKDGTGYKVDFAAKTAERAPFSPDVIMPVE